MDTGYLLGKCPSCWQPLPLPPRGTEDKGSTQGSREGPGEVVDITIGPAGSCSAGVWLCRAGAHVGTHDVFRSVCTRCVCTWGLLICRYRCEWAGRGSRTCLCMTV